jgi:hypothetical protein
MKLLRSHAIGRFSALLALLAIVMLTLLAPVHLVHALQRGSAAIAVGCHDGLAPDAGPARHDAAYQHCPICALAKAAGGLMVPTAPALPGLMVTVGLRLPAADPIVHAARRHDPRQARAPPASA